MEFDLNDLNTKSKIVIDTKVTFPKKDLNKAGILDMDAVNIKGNITSNKEENILKLNITGKMVLPCNLTL